MTPSRYNLVGTSIPMPRLGVLGARWLDQLLGRDIWYLGSTANCLLVDVLDIEYFPFCRIGRWLLLVAFSLLMLGGFIQPV